MDMTLLVNGTPRRVTLDDPGMPLIFVLRDLLGLTGTKYACLEGVCGACTVHLDGVAVRACGVPAAALDGAAITTIEGLSATGDHPVQIAWRERRVPQCGYCQSGQIMQAAAFLAATPAPDRQAILAAMAGHLCRCGTGPRILAAVERAAELMRRPAP